ncbi:MAG TPA: hypothetical protein VL651_11605 [Bacteroidia bacterium]|nr:hypothetical protein [Bacteroidia bacterium]
MKVERIFTSTGIAPPRKLHPLLMLGILVLGISVAVISFLMMHNTGASAGSGIVILFGLSRLIPSKTRPSKIFINKEADGEFYFGFKPDDDGEDTEKFIINEYRYWYCKNPKGAGVKLVFKITSDKDRTIYLTETKPSVFNTNLWEEDDEDPGFGTVRYTVADLELLALKVDQNSQVVESK